MKCGEISGHITKQGKVCAFNIDDDAKGCAYFLRDAVGRSLLAKKGATASAERKRLPRTYLLPPFDTRESIIKFVHDITRRVLVEKVDCRRVDTALRGATVALSALAGATQEKLLNVLLAVEHGHAAVQLLARLEDGLAKGTRRPLPGMVVELPMKESS